MIVCALALTLAYAAPAQTNPPPAAPGLPGAKPNRFPESCNGERTELLGNYWDGVDNENDLRVLVNQSWVLNDIGQMAGTPFPPAANFVDMNNDNLNDLVVSDSYGFLWVFTNSGKKGAPQFTIGVFAHTFLGWCAKCQPVDWDNDGDYDMIIGSFFGDITVLNNSGSRQQWKFNRKMGIPRYVDPRWGVADPKDRLPQVMLGKKPMVLGIYMSPWFVDWRKTGKPDLLLGEGTYSANSVRIAVNGGSLGKPAFSAERVFYLAYGEGFEQLTPAVVDYNGDGVNDLIVGTRTGQIKLFKGSNKPVEGKDVASTLRGTKGPAILEFDKYLKIAGKEVFDVMSIPRPCDWNNDGLFDLLLGTTKGKIYIAVNKGSKQEPEFPEAVPIKGTNTDKDLVKPTGWECDIGGICNSALLLSAEKEYVLRTGTPAVKPVAGEWMMVFRYVKDYPGWTQHNGWWGARVNLSGNVIGGRNIHLSGAGLPLMIGKRYEFSFSSILEGKPVTWIMHTWERIKEGTDTTPPVDEDRTISDTILPSGGWQKRTYQFKAPLTVQTNAHSFGLWFQLPEGDCRFLLDDFSLREVER